MRSVITVIDQSFRPASARAPRRPSGRPGGGAGCSPCRAPQRNGSSAAHLWRPPFATEGPFHSRPVCTSWHARSAFCRRARAGAAAALASWLAQPPSSVIRLFLIPTAPSGGLVALRWPRHLHRFFCCSNARVLCSGGCRARVVLALHQGRHHVHIWPGSTKGAELCVAKNSTLGDCKQ